jgi:hypothetical protein
LLAAVLAVGLLAGGFVYLKRNACSASDDNIKEEDGDPDTNYVEMTELNLQVTNKPLREPALGQSGASLACSPVEINDSKIINSKVRVLPFRCL